jgi:hypothetical protein
MCLFALEDYRDWANRLAHPLLRGFARQGFVLLSRQRSRISRWLRLASEFEIAETIRQVNVPACAPGDPSFRARESRQVPDPDEAVVATGNQSFARP